MKLFSHRAVAWIIFFHVLNTCGVNFWMPIQAWDAITELTDKLWKQSSGKSEKLGRQNGSSLISDFSRQLEGLHDFVDSLRAIQKMQLKMFNRMVTDAENLKALFRLENAEETARIHQLESIILENFQQDPYTERQKFPMGKFWTAVDVDRVESDWKFVVNDKEGELIKGSVQGDHSDDLPASMLLLKRTNLQSGYTCSEIFIGSSTGRVRRHIAIEAGIIFKYADHENYWASMIFPHAATNILSLMRVSEGIVEYIAEEYFSIHNEQSYVTLASDYSPNYISLYLNGKEMIKINTSGGLSSEGGTNGLAIKSETVLFRGFTTGPPEYKRKANKNCFNPAQEGPQADESDKDSFESLPKKGTLKTWQQTPRLLQTTMLNEEAKKNPTPNYNNKESANSNESRETNLKLHKTIETDSIDFPKSDMFFQGDAKYRKEEIKNETKEITTIRASKASIFPEVTELPESCRGYYSDQKTINDAWEINSTSPWKYATELGIQRIFVPLTPQNAKERKILLLKHNSCNSGIYTCHIRLERDSRAGILFRVERSGSAYAVIIDTPKQMITLENNIKDAIHEVARKKINSIYAGVRHKLEVLDYGKYQQGLIQVFLDDEPILMVEGQYFYNNGEAGVVILEGVALFDSFKVIP